MQSMCNMNGSQMCVHFENLLAHRGGWLHVFSGEHTVDSTVNSEFFEPVVDAHEHGSGENMPSSCRSVQE